MKQTLSRWIMGTGTALLLLGAAPLHAQEDRLPSEPNGFTWGELSLLPDYCKDVQGVLYSVRGNGQDSPRAPYWVGLMGQDFWHMHHYCYGQVAIIRGNRADLTPQQKKYQWSKAVNEYTYVIRNSSPTTPLMPEVYMKMGEAQLLLDNVGAAQSAFAMSRSLKPDYWPAYTKWADVLIGIKQHEQAQTLLREGLRHAPDSPELKKRLAQYDGGKRAAVSKPAMSPSATASAPASATPPAPAPAPAAAATSPNASVPAAPDAPRKE